VVIKNKPYLLTIRLSLVDTNELVMTLGTVQIILVVLLAGGLLLLNRALSKKLWKPFYKTLTQLKAYELDKSESITPDTTHIIEFDDLNKTVSNLTERNRKVYLQQKEFIENASHELQTPLSIFQSKLDNLMQIPGLTEAGATTIQELEDTARRMSKLNKNLLLLSKIDNEQFRGQELVDVSALADKLLSNLQTIATTSDISIQKKFASLTIQANNTLIEVMLMNLFHNAIKHTDANGNVTVEIVGRKLSVVNTGNPIKMDSAKMFERFQKESKDESSSGLGLAIVKRICDTFSYKLEYSFKEGLHFFTVCF
jgi:signal transduction histidine kinase